MKTIAVTIFLLIYFPMVSLSGTWAVEPQDVFNAVRVGDREEVSRYIASGADVNRRDEVGDSLLMQAMLHDWIEIAQLLLEAGADPNLPNATGVTPLIRSAARNHAIIVQSLLASGVDIKQRDRDGVTALSAAAHRGYLEILVRLIEAGSDINAVAWLAPLGKDSQLDESMRDNITPLILAAEHADIEVTRLLLKNGANIRFFSNKGRTALRVAAIQQNRMPLVQLLLEAGADPNEIDADGNSVLGLAVMTGRRELCELLLRYGADPNNYVGEHRARELKRPVFVGPVTKAILKRDEEILTALLSAGGDLNYYEVRKEPDKSGNRVLSPLLAAIIVQDKTLVLKLLNGGAIVSGHPISPDESVSPILMAARLPSVDIVRLLIERGSNPFDTDKDGHTLMYQAVLGGTEAMIRYLLQIGHSVDERNRNGETVLMEAVANPSTNMIRLLLELGADVRARSKRGETAMGIAAAKQRQDILLMLTQSEENKERRK